jgi:hypothetical protein
MDCRGLKNLAVYYNMYNGSGSGEAKVWNCRSLLGTPNYKRTEVTFSTLELPGDTEAPATAATDPNDPDPFCVDLTAGAGVTLSGVVAGTQAMWLSNTILHWIIVEQHACTDCDGTAMVSCSD